MDPKNIIKKYYKEGDKAYKIILEHGEVVAKKALEIAKRTEGVDLKFIEEASLLHDIGVFLTNAPNIGCFGEEPYISHGVLGRSILEKEGLSRHALVCERHLGVGITKEEIIENNLPLPERDMIPLSKEEEIISIADNFFSKSNKNLSREESMKEIEEGIMKYDYNGEKIKKWREWVKKYKL